MDNLLRLLCDNSRYTDEELAVMLGISVEEVRSQIAELEKSGLVRGYKPIIDWEKYANDRVTALIQLQITPQQNEGFDQIAEMIMHFEEVETVYLMSGGYDLTVIVSGRTFQEVAMFVAKRLAPLDPVQSTSTHFVLRRYKEMGVEIYGDNHDDRRNLSL